MTLAAFALAGHQAGDLAIKQIAATLRSSIRQSDTASRYGGEEFAILLPETLAAQAAVVAENLRAIIESMEIKTQDEQVIRITASLGICSTDGSTVLTTDELYRQADAALYRAKSGGRNRVESSDPPSPLRLEA